MILEMVCLSLPSYFSFNDLVQLTEITTLEQTRTRNRIWTPVRRLFHHHSPSPFHLSEDAQNEEEDPDMIQGIDSEVMEDLDMPKRRDPDALPPKNWMEWVLSKLYIGVAGLGGGNALYSVKAGVLTGLVFCQTPCPLRLTGF